jgi:hypothetical protein
MTANLSRCLLESLVADLGNCVSRPLRNDLSRSYVRIANICYDFISVVSAMVRPDCTVPISELLHWGENYNPLANLTIVTNARTKQKFAKTLHLASRSLEI